MAAWVAREVLESLGNFRVGDGGVEATDDGADGGVEGECGEGEGGCGAVGGVLLWKGLGEGCRMEGDEELTVPPVNATPSSASSCSSPSIPIVYAFCVAGSLSTVEM